MTPIRKTLGLAGLALATLVSVQGCIPVIVGGTGMAVAMVSDRRSSGTYVEDEGIEWKANKWVADRLGDKVHLNATAFNRKLLLTGEAFNEESREEAGRIAATVETAPAALIDAMRSAAEEGVAAYQEAWTQLTKEQRKSLAAYHERNKEIAAAADAARTFEAEPAQESNDDFLAGMEAEEARQ